MNRDYITIVTGLPRSGTSMMMQMIEAGGIPALTDHARAADDDNPRGYYEFEPVKKTKEDPSWLEQAPGKVVKMVYKLLYDLPLDRSYKVICIRRDIKEVLDSQTKMLARLGKTGGGQDRKKMATLFQLQLDEFNKWIVNHPEFSTLEVWYRNIINDTLTQAERLSKHLDGLDVKAMSAVVDSSLYRNRK